MLIQAWDGALSAVACDLINEHSTAVNLGHTLFSRHTTPPRTHLETAIHTLLREVGDDAPFVEYWSRREWKHIEAHADVDERLAAGGGYLRYPRHAHVLYLDLGTQASLAPQTPAPIFFIPGVNSSHPIDSIDQRH